MQHPYMSILFVVSIYFFDFDTTFTTPWSRAKILFLISVLRSLRHGRKYEVNSRCTTTLTALDDEKNIFFISLLRSSIINTKKYCFSFYHYVLCAYIFLHHLTFTFNTHYITKSQNKILPTKICVI